MPRLHFPSIEEMTAEQRAVHDAVLAGPRGRMIGPLRAVIHSPELARRWSAMGEFLRYATCLPRKLNELAIIVTGRHWNSQLEFLIHAQAAQEAGLGAGCIEAIRNGEAPVLADAAEAEAYEFARLLLQTGSVGDALHAAVTRRWGAQGVVELTALVGYYSMVCMMLNAQQIPLPAGAAPPLPVASDGPTVLPPSRRAEADARRA